MPNSAKTLVVRHQTGTQFVIARLEDGKATGTVSLSPPDTIQVEGRSNSQLLNDLRWYLERFLDYPFEPNTELAERIQDSVKQWGRSTFEQLFTGQALLWYDGIRTTGLTNLVLKIASDDPRVLAWPWETLSDPHGTTLAHQCRLERQLGELHDPLPLPEGLSQTQVNLLLVIARPYGDEDVGFQAVAGPLLDWVVSERVPVTIDVLRPPTFAALQQRLKDHPGHYHIVHFDGHGGYGEAEPGPSKHEYRGAQGHLIFETELGKEDPVTADKLVELLTEYRIPIMVLNACRSASIDERADDPFASTAAALLKAGIRSVVAMGYNLYVSGAQQFVPAFYRNLLETGVVAEATRAGRKAMLERDGRSCARGTYPLQDWLVPVLYQQADVPIPIRPGSKTATNASQLPAEARDLGDYGFIGRQDAIQQLERAVQRQPAAAILIHGMAGIGKTTVAKGYLHWLEKTNGLPRSDADREEDPLFVGAFWFSFDDIRSAEYVTNQLVGRLFGAEAMALPLLDKTKALGTALRDNPVLMVWDNFESAAGIDGTEVMPLLQETDRRLLKDLLKKLRGGRSKVLITSRSTEDWLTPQEAFRLPLRGLRGEDLWEYCNAVVRDLGLDLDRTDQDSQTLLRELDGHPLALRSILLQLNDNSPRLLHERLERQLLRQTGDESTRRIHATLGLVDERLPGEYAPVLRLIGLHRRYVDIDYLIGMMQIPKEGSVRNPIDRCFGTLERGGLLHAIGNGMYSLHPALPGWLGVSHPARDEDVERFVMFMAALADRLAPQPLHEQRYVFAIHGANIRQALDLATQGNRSADVAALLQSLGAYALNTRDFASATVSYERLAKVTESSGHPEGTASTYHQLGMIAQQQRDWATAERWYLKSLAIKEKQGNEHGAASTYHQLGMIAQEQRDWDTAARWYLKSLAITEKHGNERVAASTYHQLGRIAQEQRDWATAERWYLKSLAIEEKQHNEHGAAITYHQLGRMAEELRDWDTAERWYLKSLAIEEKQHNDHGAAITYHQLGRIAEEQANLLSAADWIIKAITVFLNRSDSHSLSTCVRSFLRCLGAADVPTQAAMRERWRAAGLDAQLNLADLEKTLDGE